MQATVVVDKITILFRNHDKRFVFIYFLLHIKQFWGCLTLKVQRTTRKSSTSGIWQGFLYFCRICEKNKIKSEIKGIFHIIIFQLNGNYFRKQSTDVMKY